MIVNLREAHSGNYQTNESVSSHGLQIRIIRVNQRTIINPEIKHGSEGGKKKWEEREGVIQMERYGN